MQKGVQNRIVFLSPTVQAGWEAESKIDDFIMEKQLGQGAYGKVFRAIQKKTNLVYAMKEINKLQIKHQGQKMIDQVSLELKIMYSLNHPNIIKLYNHFEEQKSLYLVIEYARQGQLYAKLFRQPQKKFSVEVVAKYIRQLMSALEEIHNKKIIHRDLKPENILLDEDDNLKLCDFGWSTYLSPNELRKTYCGTLDYMAPELHQREIQYDHNVDVWAIGVLAYELLTGLSPFSPNINVNNQKYVEAKTRANIKELNYNFPPNFPSTHAKDFITKILKINPQERLQISEMKKHKFILDHCPADIIKKIEQFNSDTQAIQMSIDKNKQQNLLNDILNQDDLKEDPGYQNLILKFTDEEIKKFSRPDSIINKDFKEEFSKLPNHINNFKDKIQTISEKNNDSSTDDNSSKNQSLGEFDKKYVLELTQKNKEYQKRIKELEISVALLNRNTEIHDNNNNQKQLPQSINNQIQNKEEINKLQQKQDLMKLENNQLQLELKCTLDLLKEKKSENDQLKKELDQTEQKQRKYKEKAKLLEKENKEQNDKILELQNQLQKKDFDIQLLNLKINQNQGIKQQINNEDNYLNSIKETLIKDLNKKK